MHLGSYVSKDGNPISITDAKKGEDGQQSRAEWNKTTSQVKVGRGKSGMESRVNADEFCSLRSKHFSKMSWTGRSRQKPRSPTRLAPGRRLFEDNYTCDELESQCWLCTGGTFPLGGRAGDDDASSRRAEHSVPRLHWHGDTVVQ